jgi:probable F420-dependent oxidoreductase
MKIGVAVRSMGPQSSREILAACVDAAEAAGLADVWIQDHIAIPPDDAEGSGGRYLDPLTTLAWLAARSERIGLGTGVLNLPYRPPLPTAKAIATVQELSEGRLRLGVGVGWMRAEFTALGIDRRQRGQLCDETLDFLERCFASDEIEAHGQSFLFRPRPAKPPIYVGGAPPHALARAVRYGEGWLPMGGDAEALKDPIARLQELAAAAGRPAMEVKLLGALPLGDPAQAEDAMHALREVGVTSLVQGIRYDTAEEFKDAIGRLAEVTGLSKTSGTR